MVANCWGPVFHLQYDDGFVAWPEEQKGSFKSIEETLEFARARGCEAEVPEETRLRWAKWKPEEIQEYHASCARMHSRREALEIYEEIEEERNEAY